jgi:hypothetical protein
VTSVDRLKPCSISMKKSIFSSHLFPSFFFVLSLDLRVPSFSTFNLAAAVFASIALLPMVCLGPRISFSHH